MTIEQRINIKLCVNLGKTATETMKMLRDVYGNSSMFRTRVFEWHKRFVEGREDVEDDPKSERPCTSTTDANNKKVRQLIRSDRHLTIRVIANEVGMDKETIRTIATKTQLDIAQHFFFSKQSITFNYCSVKAKIIAMLRQNRC